MKPNKDPKSAAAAFSAPAAASAPDTTEAKQVRVYNRSTRQTFDHGAHKLAPSSFLDVPELVAQTWMRLFPTTIIEAGVAAKELGGAAAALNLEKEEHAKTKALLDVATSRAAELGEIVTKQAAEITDLEEKLTKSQV